MDEHECENHSMDSTSFSKHFFFFAFISSVAVCLSLQSMLSVKTI